MPDNLQNIAEKIGYLCYSVLMINRKQKNKKFDLYVEYSIRDFLVDATYSMKTENFSYKNSVVIIVNLDSSLLQLNENGRQKEFDKDLSCFSKSFPKYQHSLLLLVKEMILKE